MRKSMYSPIQTQSSFAHHCLILAPSVVTCPGGLGTFEELSEFLCQRQLGLHQKPIALLNTRGFFDPLLKQFAHMIAEGFLPAAHIQSLIVEDDVTTLLDKVPPARPLLHHRKTKSRTIQTRHTNTENLKMCCVQIYSNVLMLFPCSLKQPCHHEQQWQGQWQGQRQGRKFIFGDPKPYYSMKLRSRPLCLTARLRPSNHSLLYICHKREEASK